MGYIYKISFNKENKIYTNVKKIMNKRKRKLLNQP